MDIKEILSNVDHTLLRQTATWQEIRALCDEGVRYGTASVCIPPCFVAKASAYLAGKLPVCTVIGFPNGYMTTESKVAEAKDAVANGADELDMVINLCALREKDYGAVQKDIEAVRDACRGKILKVIIETCLLTEKEK